MLHKRITKSPVYHRDFTPDKLINARPIDQFPVKDFNINELGFAKSDVGILIELSQQTNIKQSDLEAFAARLGKISHSSGVQVFDPQSKKFDREALTNLVHQWKPAWIQTQGEERQYIEWFEKNGIAQYRASYELDDKPVEETATGDASAVTE